MSAAERHVRADPLSDSPDETTGASPDGRAPVYVPLGPEQATALDAGIRASR